MVVLISGQQVKEEHRLRVTKYEFQMLQAIHFQFCQRHPYELVPRIAKRLCIARDVVFDALDLLENWYTTTVVLLFPPHFLAIAALIQAKRSRRLEEHDLADWRRRYDIPSTEIDGK